MAIRPAVAPTSPRPEFTPAAASAPSSRTVDFFEAARTPKSPKSSRSSKPSGSPKPSTSPATVSKLTPLQKHCAYFDRDGDGIITPRETFAGCRAMGMNLPLALATTVLIHIPMGLGVSKGPLPSLNIDLSNVHRGMHGSDTKVYDEHGHFDGRKFDRMFKEYDTDHDDHWSLQELWNRCSAQRDLLDVFGRVASFAEFALVYLALGESKISRDSLRKVYDGSLFYELEARQQRA